MQTVLLVVRRARIPTVRFLWIGSQFAGSSAVGRIPDGFGGHADAIVRAVTTPGGRMQLITIIAQVVVTTS